MEKEIVGFVKKELEMFKKLLKEENTDCNKEMKDEKMFILRESVLTLIFHFLKMMERDDVADVLQSKYMTYLPSIRTSVNYINR